MARLLLCDLLCLDNQLERADRQLDVAGSAGFRIGSPGSACTDSSFGRRSPGGTSSNRAVLPEFMSEVTDVLKLHLRASIALREGDARARQATCCARRSSSVRPFAGECDGEPFEDLRDLDDLTAPFLEVLTSTGKYYWVGWERIEQLEFKPPQYLRDLLWRQAEMVIRGGPDALVYVPVLYFGIAPQPGSGGCASAEGPTGMRRRADRPRASASGRFSSARGTKRFCRLARSRFRRERRRSSVCRMTCGRHIDTGAAHEKLATTTAAWSVPSSTGCLKVPPQGGGVVAIGRPGSSSAEAQTSAVTWRIC